MWVHDLRDADAACGGKALGLARLAAAGLPVPAGFVIDDRAFRALVGELAIDAPGAIGHALAEAADRSAHAEIPVELEREVRARAGTLGARLAVRSSATIEDGEAGAAAGVFSSRRAVPVADVWDAIRAVWTSALTPLAAAYARRRGGTIAIGVIVQSFIEGERLTVYTRPPGAPARDELLVQRGEELVRLARAPGPDASDANGDGVATAARYALRAEQALGAIRGADVELVMTRDSSGARSCSIVQARPIVHPQPRVFAPLPPAVLAALADGRVWTWDVAHNPDPLSVAQQGLVERVEQAAIAPWSLRVCAGFLYTAPRDAPAIVSATSARELATRAGELEARLEETLGAAPPATVDEALARYLAFYAVWAGELGPLIAAGRRALPAALRAAGHADADARAVALLGRRPSAVEATLAAAARGELDERAVERALGALAPAWDVAVPTFGERPGLLRDAIARAAAAAPAGSTPEPAPELEPVALARTAADLAERDDALFARAQQMMRTALLARAVERGLVDDDVFWIPLDDPALDPDDVHRRASAARNAAARAARWAMPLCVGRALEPSGPALHGVGTGPRVTGRVVRFASLASAVVVGAGDVVVTRAVTPALAVLVAGCGALVSETGGLLDHGAALARELGIPCVVGCRDAWTRLGDGMVVTVDGEAGTVTEREARSS